MRRVFALLLAASLCAPAGAGAAPCPNATTSGRWTTITLPAGSAGRPAALVPAARVGARDVLLAATERQVFRSADNGCTWQQVYDLGADTPASSLVRTSPLMRISDITTSGARNGARTTYALVTDDSGAFTVSMPIATLVSTDGGAHWRFNEAPAGAGVTAYPRCTSGSAISAGPDPSIAHLSCDAGSFAEFFTSAAAPQCPSTLYVTTDAGRTWTPATNPFVDPTGITPSDLSGACGRMARTRGVPVVADPVTPRVVWRLSLCGDALFRSTASGAGATQFATPPERTIYCFPELMAGALPRGGVVAAVCDGPWLFTATKPGVMAKSLPAVRSSDHGVISGCAWDARTGRAVVFYSDGQNRARLLAYDVVRRSWQSLPFLPVSKTGPAWRQTERVEGDVSAFTRSIYVRAGTRREVMYRTAS